MPKGKLKFEVECKIDINGTLGVYAHVLNKNIELSNKIEIEATTEKLIEKDFEMKKSKSDALDKRDEEFIEKINLMNEIKRITDELKTIGKTEEATELSHWQYSKKQRSLDELRNQIEKYKKYLKK